MGNTVSKFHKGATTSILYDRHTGEEKDRKSNCPSVYFEIESYLYPLNGFRKFKRNFVSA